MENRYKSVLATADFEAVDYNPFADGELSRTAPSTDAQKEVWISCRMGESASCAYNESISISLNGPLDVNILCQAFEELVRMHDALRTTFSPDGKTLCIGTAGNIAIDTIELPLEVEGSVETQLNAILEEDSRTVFDLIKGPLFRAKIIRLETTKHIIVITAHHIVCDGWSMDVLLRDLSVIYSELKRGVRKSRKAQAQYSEYASLQAEQAESAEYTKALNYWIEQLSGKLPVLDLPTDKPRPALRTYNGARQDLIIEKPDVELIRKVAAQNACSLFQVMLAAFEVLLYRISGQSDLIVGLPAAGQLMTGKSDLVGHCVNTLPFRNKIIGQQKFSHFLKDLKSKLLDAFDHHQSSFGSLIKYLSLTRDHSRIPLVSVFFTSSQKYTLDQISFDDLTVDYHLNPRHFETFEMHMNAREYDGKLELKCHYNTDLFSTVTVQNRLLEFKTLLLAIAENPDQLVDRLPILHQEEWRKVRLNWNDTAMEYPRDSSLHHLFEKQVERVPDAVAAVFQNKSLTYAELNKKSNQLARRLQSMNVGPDKLVGIYVERSLDMIVSVLAVNKAGGAYVPLDPVFPKNRLAYMMEDAGLTVLLTTNSLMNKDIPQNIPCLLLDGDSESISRESSGNLHSDAGPDHLAYVIYTSGSTGKPKGVQIPRYSLTNFLITMQKEPGLNENDVLVAVTTLSFDIAGLELFLPLITGARLIIASRGTVVDGKKLMKLLETSKATVMQATPSSWRILLEAGWKRAHGFKALCGGEALPRGLANRILDTGAELWNLYGPTETTIWSAVCRIGDNAGQIPIGHPIGNTQLYILDSLLQPVPIGVDGELYIGGDGLARGYLNREKLTSEKFLEGPFPGLPARRIYKTGDKARWLLNGNIEFVGRIDNQVKIRGFRIELEEIEALLNKHQSVKNSVVTIREDTAGTKRLIAYYIEKNGQGTNPERLRNFLKTDLPAYMIPAFFVPLDEFPLTPNGKIDRKALPELDLPDITANSAYTGPRNKIEMKLASIWERILGVNKVSVCDNFFDLGGDSLLAAQLFASIEREFGCNIPLATLFHSDSIEEIAKIIAIKNQGSSWSSLVPIQPKGSNPPLFLVHGAEGNVLLYRRLSKSLGEQQPLFGLQSPGLNGESDIELSIEDMARYYVSELLAAQPDGPYYLGGYCMGGTIALEMAQQLRFQGREVALLAMLETYNIKSRKKRPNAYTNLFLLLQNILYQIIDFLSFETKDRKKFFLEKLKVEKRRFHARLSITLAVLAHRLGLSKSIRYHHIRIDKANDKAQEAYNPSPYAGKITLFRSRRHFAGYNDRLFGWGGIAKGGVEVHIIQDSPHGVLYEPFVHKLSEKLKASIADTQYKH